VQQSCCELTLLCHGPTMSFCGSNSSLAWHYPASWLDDDCQSTSPSRGQHSPCNAMIAEQAVSFKRRDHPPPLSPTGVLPLVPLMPAARALPSQACHAQSGCWGCRGAAVRPQTASGRGCPPGPRTAASPRGRCAAAGITHNRVSCTVHKAHAYSCHPAPTKRSATSLSYGIVEANRVLHYRHLKLSG